MQPEEMKPAERKLQQLTQTFLKNKSHLYYAPVSIQQALTNADRPANGPVWASRTTFPAPKDNAILTAVVNAVIDLGDGSRTDLFPISLADVKVQWSGNRDGAKQTDEEPDISEKEKYRRLMKDTRSKTTILYIHGGFYYAGGPASVRLVTSTLARLSQGRCLVLDQRLSPQNPFPAALIDVLIAYLSLLYPPPGSFHDAVLPKDIVLAGDSSGGNLCLAFLLLVQYFQNKPCPGIIFHNTYVSIPYPAGISVFGAHGDATSSLPSFYSNAQFDFLVDTAPTLDRNFPACPLWPTDPPRSNIYTTTSFVTNPLVSPVASKSWPSNKPPAIFLAYGQERLLDDGKFIAHRAAAAGATVSFHQYNALPHIFAFIFPKLPQSRHMLSQWADFCRVCVEAPETLSRNRNRYFIYEPVDEGPGFKCVEKEVGENGEAFWEASGFEQVLEGMARKASDMRVWAGPRSVNKSSVL